MPSNDMPEFAQPRTMRDFDGKTGVVAYGMDNGLHAMFYVKPKHMEYLSQTLGHPIFQDRIMVRLIAPGNSKTVWDYEAKGIDYDTAIDPDSGEYTTTWQLRDICENGEPTDPTKYANAWANFMKKGQNVETGWPIEEWGAISRSYAESLKMLGVHTVEALAALSDSNAANIMGGIKYRQLAAASLNERKKNEIVAREQERANRAEEQNNALQDKVSQLEAIIGQMQQQYATAMGGFQAAAAGSPAPTPTPQLKKVKVRQSERTQQVLAG